ncbi:iron chaperone [Listeria weihenstephanensis]|uniref:Iron chaperone n=1 Tax=Listeria weihenstephanensis TaxID=1006155 RepID=A0A841Z9N4_9LIST|nr:iron chaperone [Listeria weihenstephanensis]MBC1501888.1 iron chaperone [Listeria weihenstephanensis]
METISDFLVKIDNPEHRAQLEDVFNWIKEEFPNLNSKIAWNQPMFTDHDTFIIGFSVAKNNFAVSPEAVVITRFSEAIKAAGYTHTANLIRFPWDKPVNYDLLKDLIEFNISDKADCETFWRK